MQQTATPPVVNLVDDDQSFVRALERLLAAEGHVVQTFASGPEFLEHRQPEARGCLVMDLQLPGAHGLELQAALKAGANPLPVIFISAHASVDVAVHAMKEGAEDFLTIPVNKSELSAAVRSALAHDAEMFARRMRQNEIRERFASLTPRECEVLDQVIAGNLNKEIASKLNISERTIKAHRAHLMEKLHAHSPAELGCIAMQMAEQV